MRISSFDVFDTLLVRSFAVPADLFLALGEQLRARGWIDRSAVDFAAERREVETLCRRRIAPEVTLEEIYTELGSRCGWDALRRGEAMQMELELERANLHAVPGMADQVEAARRSSDQVLFLTDMYLPPEFIQSVLATCGFFRPGDRLWVSGHCRMSKASGELYAAVRREFPGIAAWRHYGDNAHADVRVPRGLGIEATELAGARLSRYEVRARGEEGRGWRSRLGGAMRLARLSAAVGRPQHAAITDVSCDVVGPLLFGYVHWCLREAVERRLRRLYFVSRDGQILWRIAQAIQARWEYPLECRYLYGSRQAWHLAAVERLEASHWDWILTPTRDLDVAEVFGRVGLRPEDFTKELERGGFPDSSWRTPLADAARLRLREVVGKPALVAAIESVAAGRRRWVRRYLAQEGLLDGVPMGIVDIGWHGNLQRSLARILASGSSAPIPLVGFYLGLLLEPEPMAGQAWLAYWNRAGIPGRPLRRENLAFFEIFTSADHGSVMGYREDGAGIGPELRSLRNERALEWGLAEMQGAVVEFARRWTESVKPRDFSLEEFQAIAQANYRWFYHEPSVEEARVWGRFPYSDQQVEQSYAGLVPEWKAGEVWRALLEPGRRPTYWWHEGTAKLQPCLALSLYLGFRRFKQRIRDALCI